MGDFGIARALDSTTQNASTIVGTPYYLSPEIVENKPYSFESDVWSLGILLYEMCALEPPFNGRSIHELALRIVHAQYKEIPKQYSEDMKILIRMCLNPEAEERPSVNHLLKHPTLKAMTREFLSDDEFISEFSHTVLHNKNVFAMTTQILEESRQKEF